ncbi:hypothetical protein BOSE62_70228 [Bosea sp. 62]|nr:hypothetical protein BOSE7B_50058 [Bosea sp. 7B]CAD5300399.1 hypothetical protein BOSE21B_91441 [Bosea sp. 21B]CAD5301041.1 hypothetical protein BOSE46_90329 [Bosea sp. 46]VVT62103.1 hypothetical protein BOS5A_231371 [Bosea sp. EC-HK365B]VXB63319.1 hypothetical protein BOSE125_140042 [Bosea sp. 125]VXC71496.1 hypothetical protein BOSE62_70228 [Bosea sp. 62]VXC93952.1 hypothetical protein BOSE29B_81384 [Bosea sp. 29B]VXC96636.1 hypothetical protein BOSE127_90058 [Bosea sp. 127]
MNQDPNLLNRPLRGLNRDGRATRQLPDLIHAFTPRREARHAALAVTVASGHLRVYRPPFAPR